MHSIVWSGYDDEPGYDDVPGYGDVPGYYDEVEDKASDGGDPVGYVKRECISRLKTFKHES